MNTDGLTNPVVKAAIDALQNGDTEAWAGAISALISAFNCRRGAASSASP
jgi:hypothetical protein